MKSCNYQIAKLTFLLLCMPLIVISQDEEDIKRGVLIYDSARCMNGVNINSGFQFVDMHGNLIQTHSTRLSVDIDEHRYAGIYNRKNLSLFKDDTIVWTFSAAPHHAIFLDEDTNIVALGFEKRFDSIKGYINYEVLGTLNLDGKFVKSQSFYPLAEQLQKFLPENRDSIIKLNKQFAKEFMPSRLANFDSFFFHINSVQILPANPLEKKKKVFKHGNLLIGDFNNNFFAIIDRYDFHILWFYFQSESAFGQHSVQMLSDGRIIYFLNNIKDKESGKYYSAVRILNPLTRKIEWEYSGSPAHTLHSCAKGYCQYLNNGNVLITVNNPIVGGEAYVIEVTQSGDIVWKWIPTDIKKLMNETEGFTYVKRKPY